MKVWGLAFLIIFCLSNRASAQGWLPLGGRSNMLANATVSLVDAWSFHHNPGAVAETESTCIGFAYENRFLLKELQSQGLVIAQPLKVGVLSAGVQSFGFQLYRTLRVGIGYSMRLGDKISAGVQLNYNNVRLQDAYGIKHGVTAECGLLAHITENWSVGCSVFNIGRARLANYADDRFTTLIRLGSAYKISNKVVLLAEAEKHFEYAMRLKTGVDYRIVDRFSFRAGLATQPIELSFGFGYRWNVLQFDFGTAYHQQLGWSPHVSLTFQKN